LVADVIVEGVGSTVSETVRQTVQAVANISTSEGVQLRPLADHLKLDKSNVGRRLQKAADGGYVRNIEEKKGKPGRWIIGDPLPETTDLLPDPAQLRNSEQPPDEDRCGVAPVSDRKNDNGESEPEWTDTATCDGHWETCSNTNCGLFHSWSWSNHDQHTDKCQRSERPVDPSVDHRRITRRRCGAYETSHLFLSEDPDERRIATAMCSGCVVLPNAATSVDTNASALGREKTGLAHPARRRHDQQGGTGRGLRRRR